MLLLEVAPNKGVSVRGAHLAVATVQRVVVIAEHVAVMALRGLPVLRRIEGNRVMTVALGVMIAVLAVMPVDQHEISVDPRVLMAAPGATTVALDATTVALGVTIAALGVTIAALGVTIAVLGVTIAALAMMAVALGVTIAALGVTIAALDHSVGHPSVSRSRKSGVNSPCESAQNEQVGRFRSLAKLWRLLGDVVTGGDSPCKSWR